MNNLGPHLSPFWTSENTAIVRHSPYIESFWIAIKDLLTTGNDDVEVLTSDLIQARRTMGANCLIHPTPDKGGHLFFRLAVHHRPRQRQFLCVESRGARELWRDSKFNIEEWENVV